MVPPAAAASTSPTPSAKPAGARPRPSPRSPTGIGPGGAMPCTAIAATGVRPPGRFASSRRAPASPAAPPSTDANTIVRAFRWSAKAAASSTTDAVAERARREIGAGRHVVAVREDDDRLVRGAPQQPTDVLHRDRPAVAGAVAERVHLRLRAGVDERLPDDLRGQRRGLAAGAAIGDVGDARGQLEGPLGVEGRRRVRRQIDAAGRVQPDQRDQQRDTGDDQPGDIESLGDEGRARRPAAVRLPPPRGLIACGAVHSTGGR